MFEVVTAYHHFSTAISCGDIDQDIRNTHDLQMDFHSTDQDIRSTRGLQMGFHSTDLVLRAGVVQI